jgi:ribonuclease HII
MSLSVSPTSHGYNIGSVSFAAPPREIDRLGLTKAEYLAILRALQPLDTSLPIVLDGKHNFLANRHPHAEAIIGADDSVPAVSAASIIAKVQRDYIMNVYGLIYPDYGFDRHVGYGTAEHIAALDRFGITSLHRRSYKPIQRYV